MGSTKTRRNGFSSRSGGVARSLVNSVLGRLQHRKISRFGTASSEVWCSGVVVVPGLAVFLVADYGAGGNGVRPQAVRPAGAPNAAFKLGAKSADSAGRNALKGSEHVVQELAKAVRAERMPVESASHDERAAPVDSAPTAASEDGRCACGRHCGPRHLDELVGLSGLNSAEA